MSLSDVYCRINRARGTEVYCIPCWLHDYFKAGFVNN